MKIEITGSRCITCHSYTQYYQCSQITGEFEAIDCGFCGERQCSTGPGNRCRRYRERSNVGVLYKGRS